MLGKCVLHDTQQDNGRNFIQERLQIRNHIVPVYQNKHMNVTVTLSHTQTQL